MTDTVLVQDGKAHEIFAGRTLEDMAKRRHPEVVKLMVEVRDGAVELGDVWDGSGFSKPVIPTEPPRPRDPIAELDALKAILAQKGILTEAVRVR
jgi:hypothetical protein